MEAVDRMALRELVENKDRLRAEVADIQAIIKEIDGEVSRRYEARVQEALAASGKETGQVTFRSDTGEKLQGEVKKTVKWDSSKLQAVAASLPWEMVQRVFDVKFSVPEKTYSALTDESLRKRIEEARTVEHKPQPIKVSLE